MMSEDAPAAGGWDLAAINFYRLRIYCAVVEQQGFTAAAERLFLTQPAVSLQVRAMERGLGAELLYQEGHRTLPTTLGQAFYEYARGVLQEAERVQGILADLGAGRVGTLAIGATLTPGTYLLPGIVRRFQTVQREARVSVDIAATCVVCERVLGGELDLGFVVQVDVPAGLISRPIRRERLLVVAAPSHPLAGQCSVPLAALAGESFACAPPGQTLRTLVDAKLRAYGLERRQVVAEFTHPESVKRVVQEGDTLAVLFGSSIQQEVALGLLQPLDVPAFDAWHEFVLVYRPRKQFSPLLQAFVQFVQDELAPPDGGPPVTVHDPARPGPGSDRRSTEQASHRALAHPGDSLLGP